MPQKVSAETIHNRTSEWVSNLRSKPRRHRASRPQDVQKSSTVPVPALLEPLDVPSPETDNSRARTPTARTTIATNQADPRPKFTDEVVILQNGSEAGAISVKIRKELLDHATSLYRATSRPCIVSTRAEPQIFEMFITWLNQSEDPVPFLPCHYSPEPWRSRAVDAWLFARKINASDFERYALSHVISNCSMQDSSYFKHIEEKAGVRSSLLRFCNHWVAWNVYFAAEGQSEYRELAAAKLAYIVNGETNDPRIYEIEHWYSPCGDDINSNCNHDPVVRENAVNAMFASRRPKPRWGLKWEEENPPPRRDEANDSSVSTDEKPKLPP